MALKNLCASCKNKFATHGDLCQFCYEEAVRLTDEISRDLVAIKKSKQHPILTEFDTLTPLLENSGCIITPYNGQKAVIDTQTEKWGILDYFPKSDRLLMRSINEWKDGGLQLLKDLSAPETNSGQIHLGRQYGHKNGNIYTPIILTNTATQREDHPIAVVYVGQNGNVWSRNLNDWDRSFTLI